MVRAVDSDRVRGSQGHGGVVTYITEGVKEGGAGMVLARVMLCPTLYLPSFFSL